MLREGKSFSGRERNCLFLNTGEERFADVSGASGFDFPDDARGLAVADWDFDGDLDVWLANQTAPRIRFLRNDGNHHGRFIALKLRGVHSNRDAIGARVELTWSDKEGARQKRVCTLRAGAGFLSQSSKWLHFGLDAAGEVNITVRWPAGDTEHFGTIATNAFYELSEGASVAKQVAPPRNDVPLSIAAASQTEREGGFRVLEPGRPEIPHAEYIDATGKTANIRDASGRPVLVTLWASWCAPCLEELRDLTRHEDDIASAQLDVLAINIERLADGPDSDPTKHLATIGFPFDTGMATSSLVTALDAVQRATTDRPRPLALPTSFLLDDKRRLIAIYKGQANIQQILNDVKLVGASADTLRDAASASRGRWATEPYSATPVHRAIVRRFAESGALDEASRFAEQTNLTDADTYAQLATAYAEAGRWKVAIELQEHAIRRARPPNVETMKSTLRGYRLSIEKDNKREP